MNITAIFRQPNDRYTIQYTEDDRTYLVTDCDIVNEWDGDWGKLILSCSFATSQTPVRGD